jgi:hypothetical protein
VYGIDSIASYYLLNSKPYNLCPSTRNAGLEQRPGEYSSGGCGLREGLAGKQTTPSFGEHLPGQGTSDSDRGLYWEIGEGRWVQRNGLITKGAGQRRWRSRERWLPPASSLTN